MLSISDNHVHIDIEKYKSFEMANLSKANVLFRRFLIFLSVCLLVLLFLPWTQNIRAKGLTTTLTPDQRPQTIPATIAGRIEKWYVREGQLVKKGDTIVHITEIKTDYFDPDLLSRTQAQVDAKQSAVGSYGNKAKALEEQVTAMRSELKFKKDQLRNKLQQNALKAEAERNAVTAASIDLETEKLQLARTEEMFKQGLKSRTELENKRLKLQQTQAKLIEIENKYRQTLQENDNLAFQLKGIDSEYEGKIAKSESDRFSTLSDKFDAEATTQKLKNQYSNYAFRQQFYYIIAPQDCYITKATTVGIGEMVKEGDPIVSIVPQKMDMAVEMFIDPIDLPLIKIGAPVRFIFDGWPAFIFSGWPQATIGTFSGNVWAIDNVANPKGQYRIIVAPDPTQPKWPEALRPGSGAKGFALLKDVPIWYELWRQLNGFPPEYYKLEDMLKDKEEKKK